MSNSAFFSDLHIHTKQSGCAPRTSEAASYLPYCKQEGIRLLGISDHVYSDETLRECGYVNENKMSHLLVTHPILEELAKTSDVRFLFGCEAEYFPGQPPLISQEESLSFDYILMAASHVLNQPKMYSAYDIHDPNVLRKLTIDPKALEGGDVEMLQDLIMAAVNEAGRIARETAEREMSAISGGIKLPGIF